MVRMNGMVAVAAVVSQMELLFLGEMAGHLGDMMLKLPVPSP